MKRGFLIFISILSAAGASASGENLRIQVRPSVELEMENEITVGDIADFEGFSNSEVDELRAVHLGEAPAQGESRVFTSIGISQVFRAHLPRLQKEKAEKITVTIPDRVVVKRRKFQLEAKDVEAEIHKQLRAICAECEFVIDPLNMPILGAAAAGANSWHLKMRPELPRGTFAAPLEIRSLTGRRTFWVSGNIQVFRKVPVAQRAIEFGRRISNEDVVFERKDISFQTDSHPPGDELFGSVAARGIATGQMIGRSMIRREQGLRSGETVKIRLGGEAWQITVDGIAQQAAYVGDPVRVRVASTQKIVTGLLKEKGLVEVQAQ